MVKRFMSKAWRPEFGFPTAYQKAECGHMNLESYSHRDRRTHGACWSSDLPKSVSSRFTQHLISKTKVKSHRGRWLTSISGFHMLEHTHTPVHEHIYMHTPHRHRDKQTYMHMYTHTNDTNVHINTYVFLRMGLAWNFLIPRVILW